MKINSKSTPVLVFLFLFFVLTNFHVSGQKQQSTPNGEKYEFSLKQAIDYALAHQNNVLNAGIDEKIAKQKVREITGTGLPQINGSVEADDYFQKPVTIIPGAIFSGGRPAPDIAVSFLKQYQATAGVSGSQLIFNGSYLVGLQAAKTYAELSQKLTKSSKIEVVANVTKAYYGVVVNEKNLTTLDANIELLQKSLSDIKAMYAQGFVEKLDVDRLQVTLSNLQVNRQNVQSYIDLNYYLLKFQMGMPVNSTLKLTESIPDQFPAPSVEKAEFDKRIEYSILKTQGQLYHLDVKNNKAGYLPTVVLIGSLSTVAYRDQFDFFDTKKMWYPTGLLALKISVPIFDGFQKDARIKQANLNVAKNQNDLLNFQNIVDLQVKQSSISYGNNFKILETQKANLTLAEDVARVTKIKYEQGVGSNLEVVTAETSLREAQNNYFSALYNIAVSYVDLQKAKGTLY
jgi:outer membrane protein